MSQALNSLIVSDHAVLQRALEEFMLNNTYGYHVTLSTCALDTLSRVNRPPDLIFIENPGGLLKPEQARQVVRKFPRKIYVVIDSDPEEDRRREFMKVGMDEVLSLQELQSDVGRHLLEKLLALKKITEAEDRIEESEERFRGIIENARDVITLLDDEFTIIYNSQAFERQMGYETWEVLGQSFFDFIHEDERAYVEHKLKQQVADPDSDNKTMEFRFRHKDGRWRIFEATVSNLLRNALVRALVLNSRDVTEHKISEAELEQYRYNLQELVEQRTHELTLALETERRMVEQQKNFISMVSHEFRTPLTIIDGNAQILLSRGETLTEDVRRHRIETIRSGVSRLVRLIETILSANTLESGKLTMTRAPGDLSSLLRDVAVERLEISPKHKIRLDIAPNLPPISMDEKVMRQIITNLISNAIKYSPDSVEIEARLRRDGDKLVMSITDHGVGIPLDELPNVFTRYFRASTSSGIPGSGLGLNLVKQFVELHDGDIKVESEEGAGTTVAVRLPIHQKENKGE